MTSQEQNFAYEVELVDLNNTPISFGPYQSAADTYIGAAAKSLSRLGYFGIPVERGTDLYEFAEQMGERHDRENIPLGITGMDLMGYLSSLRRLVELVQPETKSGFRLRVSAVYEVTREQVQ